jgi:(4S)-4-hydroxy-5-phosphonooxypentane-2,3-dione isomerase
MSKVFLFVAIEVQPGKSGAFLKKLEDQIEMIRGEVGCEEIDLFKNSDDENLLHVWEVWSDRESWDAHMANEASKIWQATAANFVVGEKITVMGRA